MNSVAEHGSDGSPGRDRLRARCAALLAAVLVIAAGGVAAAAPASAATTRCSQVPAGYAGWDTLKACTTVGLTRISSKVTYYTSPYRAGPRDVDLDNILYMNDGIQVVVGGIDCGAMAPGDSCSLEVGHCNPAGTQKWYTAGRSTSDHVGIITYGYTVTPAQYAMVLL
jgi:hypothetical protein